MRLDHLSYAAGPDGLAGTTTRLAEALGEKFLDGGVHPRFGTRNAVLPLAGGRYLEVVEVLDHPASDKAPFGQIVRSRSLAGGGWLGWVLAVEDISVLEHRLGRPAVKGSRRRPDGVELCWKQIGVLGLQADPQLPFFVEWGVAPADHPSAGATGALALKRLEISGHPSRVERWLGRSLAELLDDVQIDWVAPRSTPGLLAAQVQTPEGVVRI